MVPLETIISILKYSHSSRACKVSMTQTPAETGGLAHDVLRIEETTNR